MPPRCRARSRCSRTRAPRALARARASRARPPRRRSRRTRRARRRRRSGAGWRAPRKARRCGRAGCPRARRRSGPLLTTPQPTLLLTTPEAPAPALCCGCSLPLPSSLVAQHGGAAGRGLHDARARDGGHVRHRQGRARARHQPGPGGAQPHCRGMPARREPVRSARGLGPSTQHRRTIIRASSSACFARHLFAGPYAGAQARRAALDAPRARPRPAVRALPEHAAGRPEGALRARRLVRLARLAHVRGGRGSNPAQPSCAARARLLTRPMGARAGTGRSRRRASACCAARGAAPARGARTCSARAGAPTRSSLCASRAPERSRSR